jgi:hypothetical protein
VDIPAEKIEEIYAYGIDEVQVLDLRATSWNDLYAQALVECARFLDEAAAIRCSARSAGAAPKLEEVAERFESSAAAGILSGKAPDLRWNIAAAIREPGWIPMRTFQRRKRKSRSG